MSCHKEVHSEGEVGQSRVWVAYIMLQCAVKVSDDSSVY